MLQQRFFARRQIVNIAILQLVALRQLVYVDFVVFIDALLAHSLSIGEAHVNFYWVLSQQLDLSIPFVHF